MDAESYQREIFICDCGYPGHFVVLEYYDKCKENNWDILSIFIATSSRGFWRRLKMAVKYVFGKLPVFRSDTYICLNDKDAHRMKEFILRFLAREKQSGM